MLDLVPMTKVFGCNQVHGALQRPEMPQLLQGRIFKGVQKERKMYTCQIEGRLSTLLLLNNSKLLELPGN